MLTLPPEPDQYDPRGNLRNGSKLASGGRPLTDRELKNLLMPNDKSLSEGITGPRYRG